jgi:hypothetical protein
MSGTFALVLAQPQYVASPTGNLALVWHMTLSGLGERKMNFVCIKDNCQRTSQLRSTYTPAEYYTVLFEGRHLKSVREADDRRIIKDSLAAIERSHELVARVEANQRMFFAKHGF